MARRRRKSITGRVLQEATRALPGPLQMAFATPTRACITIAVIGALMSYGVVSVQWQDGRPKLSVDEQKAHELKDKGLDWISKQEDQIQDRILGTDDEPSDSRLVRGVSGQLAPSPAPLRAPFNTARQGRVGIRRD